MERTKWVHKLGFTLAAMTMVALLFVATPIFAQEAGTILGVVKDSSGGAVPAAKITVTNSGTNESRTTTTGDDGAWRIPGLAPGQYSVKTEKEGFKTSTSTGLTLDVAQQLVVNPVLEVGAATQEVTVTGEAPLVNTTTSSLGGLVNDTRVADLPLNGRNYIDLTLLQPGVQENTHPPGGGAGSTGTWYSSNGAPPRSNNFTLDGAIMTNQYGAGAMSEAATTLGVDGIKEYKVVTTNFSADYGMSMGSQMVIVSKSGTNNWHGDAFEYLRNSVLDARNFFDTGYLNGGPRLPEFQRNNFGGSAGGPIIKDKTFFYLVYEGLRARTGATITDTEPPAACHDLVPIGEGGMGTIAPGYVKDIGLAGPAIPAGANLANPGACASGLTNTSVIQPVTQPWLGQLPIPLNSSATNNFTYPAEFATREDYTQLRVDHHIGVNDSFFGRYTFDDAYLDSPFANIQIQTTGAALPQYNTIGRSRNQWTTFGEDHIFSPTLLNSIRLSFSRTNFRVYPEAETVDSLGGNPLNPFGPLIGPNWSAVAGYGGAWAPTGYQGPSFLGTAPAYHVQNLWTLADDIFLTKGKNAFKFGFLGNAFEDPNVISKGLSGGLTFSNLSQFMLGTPSAISAFISPYPGYTEGCPPSAVNTTACDLVGNIVLLPPYNGNSPDRDFMYKTFGFYGQDDYRATNRLTLNLGLRYEFQTTFRELYGRESTLLDIEHSSSVTTGLMMDNPSLRNFSPRIGFAWDVFGTGKTSVRSGFGIYYDVGNYGAMLTQAPTGFPPFSAQTNYSFSPVGSYQLTTAAADLPVPYNQIVPPSSIGRNLQGNDYNMKQPYSLQYNLTVEQQLPGGIGLSVSYVGNRGIHLITGEEGNPVLPYAYDINGTVEPVTIVNGAPQLPNGWPQGIPEYPVSTPIPGSAGGTGLGGCFNNSLNPAYANTFTGNKSPCRINPYWGSFELYTAGAESWYNSLQVLVTKPVSHGLDFQAAYTWSHAEDTTQGQMFGDDCAGTGSAIGINPGNPILDKANACFNAPNSLHVNFIYHVPTIKSNGFLSKAVNGWWVSTIATAQQGFPVTPALTNQPSFSGIISQSHADNGTLQTTSNTVTLPVTANPNAPAAPNCSLSAATCTYSFVPYNPNSVVVGNPSEWYNPLMFSQAPLGIPGDSGRNILPGPNEFEWDFSVVKDTRLGFLGEQGNLEFRAEMFNILNHANFGQPGSTFYTGVTNASALNGGDIAAPVGASTSNPYGTSSTVTTTRTNSRQIQLALKIIF